MKRRSSDEEHVVDHANMAKEIFGDYLPKNRMMTVPKIASKVLIHPATTSKTSKQRSKQQENNNERLDAIIARIIKYRDNMREAFTEYCKAAIEEGFTANEAWQYISKRLVDVVPRATLYRWVEKELPLEAKKSTRPRSKKILK